MCLGNSCCWAIFLMKATTNKNTPTNSFIKETSQCINSECGYSKRWVWHSSGWNLWVGLSGGGCSLNV